MSQLKQLFENGADRCHTCSVKWDMIEKRGLPADVLPLWVADMDFQTVPEVVDAVKKVAERGLWGYSFAGPDYYEAVIDFMQRRHQFTVEADWIVQTPGVVAAINRSIEAFTEPGDPVLILEPVYHPFRRSIETLGRRVVSVPLLEDDLRYTMDFAAIERAVIDNNINLMIFCSPHNPVGRVWTLEELGALKDIIIDHDMRIVSDEIHHDLIMPGFKHHVFGAAYPELMDRLVTCTAPSKTFNLAGLAISNIIIADPEMREQFKASIQRASYPNPTPFSIAACHAAYQYGDEWLDTCCEYIAEQSEALKKALKEYELPIRVTPKQGMYLDWLDCRAISEDPEELDKLFLDEARLWLNNGAVFGEEGRGFMRFNLACKKGVPEEAVKRLAAALAERG